MARPLRTSDNSQLHGLVLRRYGGVGAPRAGLRASCDYFVTIATYKVRKYQRDTSEEVATGGGADMLSLGGGAGGAGFGAGVEANNGEVATAVVSGVDIWAFGSRSGAWAGAGAGTGTGTGTGGKVCPLQQLHVHMNIYRRPSSIRRSMFGFASH